MHGLWSSVGEVEKNPGTTLKKGSWDWLQFGEKPPANASPSRPGTNRLSIWPQGMPKAAGAIPVSILMLVDRLTSAAIAAHVLDVGAPCGLEQRH